MKLHDIHIAGETLDWLAGSEKGLEFLRCLDADWSYLREMGVEEIYHVQSTHDVIVQHRVGTMPWMFNSIRVPNDPPEVWPAVLAYVSGSKCPQPEEQP